MTKFLEVTSYKPPHSSTILVNVRYITRIGKEEMMNGSKKCYIEIDGRYGCEKIAPTPKQRTLTVLEVEKYLRRKCD